MTVYLDQVWLLNTLLDYLLLVATARFSGREIRRSRFLLVALLGGFYGTAGFIWPWLHLPLLRLLIGILLGLLAFRGSGRCTHAVAVFFLLSAAMAGVMMALGLYTMKGTLCVLLVSSGVFVLLLEAVFRQGARCSRGDIKTVHIRIADRECTLRALYDTGNTLRSPINGAPVLVVEASSLRNLWSREEAIVLLSDRPVQEKVAHMYRLGSKRYSLLPYTAVGGSGLLLCMRADTVTVGRRTYRRAPVALMDHALGIDYDALWGGEDGDRDVASVHTCMDLA